MSLGFALFIAADVLGAASAVSSCRRTSRYWGGAAAAREAVVLAASLAAYTAVCILVGYGMWPQVLGCLLAAAVVAAGWHWAAPRKPIKGDD
jgi:hypothetical protein